MKATKNQANAVRSYLATLGVEISHVQALEVIARGAGNRSRHIKDTKEPAQPGTLAVADNGVFFQAKQLQSAYCTGKLDLPTATAQLMDLFPELFDTSQAASNFLEDGNDESIWLFCSEISLANAIRDDYRESDKSSAALAKALRELVKHCDGMFKEYSSAYYFLGTNSDALPTPASMKVKVCKCQACDSSLDENGYCSDTTCVYSDWPQSVQIGMAYSLPVEEIEHLTGVKKRVYVESEASSG